MKRSTTFGRIDTGIRQLEFVTSTQFLSESYFSKKIEPYVVPVHTAHRLNYVIDLELWRRRRGYVRLRV